MTTASHDDQWQQAYVAAAQAAVAMSVRHLLAIEGDDPDVGSLMVEVSLDGAITVTMRSAEGFPVGGYSL